MPTSPFHSRRFSRLSAALLVIALAAPAATPKPAVAPAAITAEATVDARIGRCLELRRSRPREALELADAVLATPGLDGERRIKALSCQGIAAGLVGDRDRAVAIADRIAVELQRQPQLPDAYRLRALSNLGAILHGAGQIYRAEKVYAETLGIGARIGGSDAVRIQASTLNNIGMVHADYLTRRGQRTAISSRPRRCRARSATPIRNCSTTMRSTGCGWASASPRWRRWNRPPRPPARPATRLSACACAARS
ncbi:hypothetical protein H1235_07400 [Pseudoxanthomonas sp. NC8]|nr:hypothetical protein H1235_07400 [Pseudoxanthomonas sp. NC8]